MRENSFQYFLYLVVHNFTIFECKIAVFYVALNQSSCDLCVSMFTASQKQFFVSVSKVTIYFGRHHGSALFCNSCAAILLTICK